MGSWQAPAAAYDTGVKALGQGIVDGYNTMDGLAALVFGIIVVESVKMYGAVSEAQITKDTLRSGLISTFSWRLFMRRSAISAPVPYPSSVCRKTALPSS